MRGWTLLSLLATASCAGATFQPTMVERRGIDPIYTGVYSVEFEVACDSCRVVYGEEGSLFTDVAEGSFRRSLPLGTLRDGSRVRVELHVTPLGDVTVVRAAIEMGGRTLRSGKSDEPGKPVSVRATIRG